MQAVAAPGAMVPGEQDMLESVTAGWIVSVADRDGPVDVAEMVALCTLATAAVVTVKFALSSPAGTVNCDCTVALPLLLASDTGVPPEGAADARVTVHVVLEPPLTVDGTQITDCTPGWVTPCGVRLIEKLREFPFNDAVIPAVVLL